MSKKYKKEEEAKEKNATLFDPSEFNSWNEEWKGMPEFVQKDLQPHRTLLIHFTNDEGVKEFAELVDCKISPKTQSIWFPKTTKIESVGKLRYKAKNNES